MNVWDKFTAQSPRKLFRVERAQIVSKREREGEREEHSEHFEFLVLSALHADGTQRPPDPSPARKHASYSAMTICLLHLDRTPPRIDAFSVVRLVAL